MPFSTPETADATKAAVSTAMIATSRPVPVFSIQLSSWMPLPICRAPRPSEAAEPKRVAKMARMSMIRPTAAVGVPLADERDEHRADGLPPVPPVGAVGDGQARRPRRSPRGGASSGTAWWPSPSPWPRPRRRGAVPGRRIDEVGQRLAHSVEHQADAHAGAEHHRDPGDRAELGLLALLAERDPPVAADRQPEGEDHEAGGGQHEGPAAVVDEAVEQRAGDVFQRVGGRGTPDDEGEGEHCGDAEHHPVGRGPAAVVPDRRADRPLPADTPLARPVLCSSCDTNGTFHAMRIFRSP